ncbi:MAG: UDP-N-acetylmuramoyl-L-alanine--D-glutamate ligase [Cellvibrionaceae bacterium]
MTQLIAKNNVSVLIGTGLSGRSAARYLQANNQLFVWLDTREKPPALTEIEAEFPSVDLELGPLNIDTLLSASQIIVSPGVSLATPEIAQAKKAGIEVVGDVELFLRQAKAPVVAITGSNAKSTVTSLVGQMAEDAGINVAVGGNIGIPVLDLLQEKDAELYVLELSSFQLETVEQVNAEVATVLNVCEDHMDRYDSLFHYHLAKQRVYYGAKTVVTNREDPLTVPPIAEGVKQVSFGLNQPDRHGFGILQKGGEDWLAFEFKPLMACSKIRMPGRHNIANALSALALGYVVNIPMESMLKTLTTFSGLPHRCEWIAESDGVKYFNDSKGTNVGATLAAIHGLACGNKKIVLIAGGVGKGADFSPLCEAAEDLRCAVLIGEDAQKIAEVLKSKCDIKFAASMGEAVALSKSVALAGDTVLLSPACASFDMFDGFEARGKAFVGAVQELLA